MIYTYIYIDLYLYIYFYIYIYIFVFFPSPSFLIISHRGCARKSLLAIFFPAQISCAARQEMHVNKLRKLFSHLGPKVCDQRHGTTTAVQMNIGSRD